MTVLQPSGFAVKMVSVTRRTSTCDPVTQRSGTYLTPVYCTTVPLVSVKLPMILFPEIVPTLRER